MEDDVQPKSVLGEEEGVRVRGALPWEAVGKERSGRNVWTGDSGLFDMEENPEELRRIAGKFAPVVSENKKRAVSTTAQKQAGSKISVLDPKRATTISVAMKRMKIQPNKLGKLAWALRDMNESFLTPSAVEIMAKSMVWASPQEIAVLKSKVKEGVDLSEPDALLWYLATAVPDTAERIDALQFRYEFSELVSGLIAATSMLKAATLEILSSGLLKRVLRVVVLLGNKINEAAAPLGEDPPIPVVGVHITSLAKLTTVRSPLDRNMSVMDCLVEYLQKTAPECFDVSDELMVLPNVRDHSLNQLVQMLKDAKKGVEKCNRIKKMETFCSSAFRKLTEIEKEASQAKQSFEKCLDYFALSHGSMDADVFFTHLMNFLQAFDKAVQDMEEKQRRRPTQGGGTGGRMGGRRPSFMVRVFGPGGGGTRGGGGGEALDTLGELPLKTGAAALGSSAGGRSQRKTSFMPRQSIFGRIKPNQ